MCVCLHLFEPMPPRLQTPKGYTSSPRQHPLQRQRLPLYLGVSPQSGTEKGGVGQGHPMGNHSNYTPNGCSSYNNAILIMAGTVPQEGWEWPCHHSSDGREWECSQQRMVVGSACFPVLGPTKGKH